MSENNQKMAPHLEAGEKERGNFCGPLTGVKAVEKGERKVISSGSHLRKILRENYFSGRNIFRYDVDPSGAFES